MLPLDVAMLSPWERVEDGRGLEAELARELVAGHVLFGKTVRAAARRWDRDDFLFVGEEIVAVVHLTWSRETDPHWPSTVLYASLSDWIERGMFYEHLDLVDTESGTFMLAFDYPSGLESLAERLTSDPRRGWSVGSDALVKTEGATRLAITWSEEEAAMVLRVQAIAEDVSFRDPATTLESWYPDALRSAIVSLLALGATRIRSRTE